MGAGTCRKNAPQREAGGTGCGGGNVETFAGVSCVAWGWRTRIRKLTHFFNFCWHRLSSPFRVSPAHKDPTNRRLSSLHLPPPLPFLIQTLLSLAALIKARRQCLPWVLDRYFAWGKASGLKLNLPANKRLLDSKILRVLFNPAAAALPLPRKAKSSDSRHEHLFPFSDPSGYFFKWPY